MARWVDTKTMARLIGHSVSALKRNRQYGAGFGGKTLPFYQAMERGAVRYDPVEVRAFIANMRAANGYDVKPTRDARPLKLAPAVKQPPSPDLPPPGRLVSEAKMAAILGMKPGSLQALRQNSSKAHLRVPFHPVGEAAMYDAHEVIKARQAQFDKAVAAGRPTGRMKPPPSLPNGTTQHEPAPTVNGTASTDVAPPETASRPISGHMRRFILSAQNIGMTQVMLTDYGILFFGAHTYRWWPADLDKWTPISKVGDL